MRRKTKIRASVAVARTVLAYRELKKETHIIKDPLLEELDKYFGKKGNILVRPTRYEKNRKHLNDLLKRAYEKYHGKTKKALKRENKKKVVNIQRGRKKAAETYGINQIQEDIDLDTSSIPGATGSIPDFSAIALESTDRYRRATSLYDMLGENIRNKVSIYLMLDLVESNASDSDIKALFQSLEHQMDELPDEALDLALNDDFWKMIGDLGEDKNIDDIKGLVNLSLMQEVDDPKVVFDYFTQNNNTDKTFIDFVDELQQYNFKDDISTWEEIINEWKED